MASVEPVCRKSKYSAKAKPQKRTQYICCDTDRRARHTVVIKPRTLPRSIEQMVQRSLQLLVKIRTFMYSTCKAYTMTHLPALLPGASQTRAWHRSVSLARHCLSQSA